MLCGGRCGGGCGGGGAVDGCSQEHAESALVAVFGPPLEASDEVVW